MSYRIQGWISLPLVFAFDDHTRSEWFATMVREDAIVSHHVKHLATYSDPGDDGRSHTHIIVVQVECLANELWIYLQRLRELAEGQQSFRPDLP